MASAPAPARARLGYRPALDGLRAISVLAVILHHARPSLVPGGFIGVDVFFVLSGFLITSLQIEEEERPGRISLRQFYLRHRPAVPGVDATLPAPSVVAV